MTVLASNSEYLVEYENTLFTIARRTDGHCKAIHKKDINGISGNFKNAKMREGTDGAIKRFLRIATALGADWEPLYKPHKMP